MSKVIRRISEISSEERRIYESVLGEPLRDDQQVVLEVVSPGLPDWCDVYKGLSDAEIAEVEEIALRRSKLHRPSP